MPRQYTTTQIPDASLEPLNPADIKVSVLANGVVPRGKRQLVYNLSTLGAIVKRIRESEDLQKRTATLRDVLADKGRKGPYETLKLRMPAIIPAASAPANTPVRGMSPAVYHNGLYGYDIDEDRENLNLPQLLVDLIAAPGAATVGLSSAGDALYAIFAGPFAQSDKEYKENWIAIADQMPAGAKVASGESSKNFNRLRLIVYDPDVWLADSVLPLPGAAQTRKARNSNRTHNGRPGTGSDSVPPWPDDHAIDADAASWIRAQEDYNKWLGWLPTLKALDFTIAEVESWSSTGDKYVPGEVERRWPTLMVDDPADARNKLRGHAHNLGWRNPKGAFAPGDAGPWKPGTPAAGRSEWHQFGEWFARTRAKGRYLYNNTPGELAWWYYDGKSWHCLQDHDPRLSDEIARDRFLMAHELVSEGYERIANTITTKSEWNAAKGARSDMWAGLRDALAGKLPQPELHILGTTDGVVDQRDGSITDHHPKFGIRALTAGRYRPDDGAAHLEALHARFGKVFTSETLLDYLRLIALALTGRAQSYRAVVMVVGKPGSGKGDCTNVLLNALGKRGVGVSAEWLGQQSRNDIDATGADILEYQPAVIKVDEIGGDTKIGISKFMSMTGNAPRHARRPHGPLHQGVIRSQFWTTAASAPQMPRGSGIERRLAVLPTLRKLDDWEIDEEGATAQPLLDAVITRAVQEAAAFYRNGYVAPEGDREVKAKLLREMDEVADWLESQDDLDGMPVRHARARAMSELGLGDGDLSPTMFGLKVKDSDKWERIQRPGGGRVIQRRSSSEEYML